MFKAILLIIILSNCSLLKEESENLKVGDVNEIRRVIASNDPKSCNRFNNFYGEDKREALYLEHLESMEEVEVARDYWLASWSSQITSEELESALNGDSENTFNYVRGFMRGQKKYGKEFFGALTATTKFLTPTPEKIERVGYKTLKPTFLNTCEIQEESKVKKVHALGALAKAKLKIYEQLIELDKKGKASGQNVKNPYSGLLGQFDSDIKMLLRFSIANPLAFDLDIKGQRYQLEFIPGLGMKFFIDGKRSVDLVAMESLAGQGSNQNFFLHEFSPDFSEKAPSDFNAEADPKKKSMIMKRYKSNAINHFVMNLVGKRFAQVVPHIMPDIKLSEIMEKAHSNIGPHPFLISIQDLAKYNSQGEEIESPEQKRPWRLILSPALNNIESERLSKIIDKTSYTKGNYPTDFRHKLASLKSGDRIYYLLAETKDEKRYRLGEVVLESAVLPSKFADRLYFIQHKLDTARILGKSIPDLD